MNLLERGSLVRWRAAIRCLWLTRHVLNVGAVLLLALVFLVTDIGRSLSADPASGKKVKRSGSGSQGKASVGAVKKPARRPLKKLEKFIVWGKAAQNGLQVGVVADPPKDTFRWGEVVRFRFVIRNTGKQAIKMRLPKIFQPIFAGISVVDEKKNPVSTIRGAALNQEALVAGFFARSLEPNEVFDFSQDLLLGVGTDGGDKRVAWVLNAKREQVCQLRFTLNDFSAVGGRILRRMLPTGTLDFTISSDDGIGVSGSRKPGRLRMVRSFEHTHGPNSLAFTTDGKQALLAGDTRYPQLTLRDLDSGQTVRRFAQSPNALFLNVSPAGKFAASSGLQGTVVLWDLAKQRPVSNFKANGMVIAVAFSPDGTKLAAAGMQNRIYVWEPLNGGRLIQRKGHADGAIDLAYFPDGKRLVSVGFDHKARIWAGDLSRQIRAIAHPENVWSVAVSPDGTQILTGTGGSILGQVGEQRYEQSRDNKLRLFNAETGKLIREFAGHLHLVRDIKFSPDGRYAASASYDKSIRLWDLKTGKELARNNGAAWIYALAFSPDGSHLLASGGSMNHGNNYWTGDEQELVRLFRVLDEDELEEGKVRN